MPHRTNLLIESLPQNERQALTSHLEVLELKSHQILFDIGDVLTHVYFPTDCVVSLAVPLSTGQVVESAMIGRDGIVGTFAALDGRVSLNPAIVQIAGQALRCQVEAFNAIVQNHSVVRRMVAAHEQALFAQSQQSAACNVTHVIESRLARWLLRAADLTGANELEITQEYIAQMLGVRRTSVTVVARTLQQAEMIHYRRGLIKLADIPALRQVACECYQTVKLNYEALLHSAK